MTKVQREAYSHPFPQDGGLVLCADCASNARARGQSSERLSHADLAPNWSMPVTVAKPVYCDNCCDPIVAHDTPEK